ASQLALAPLAGAAAQVDFADDAAADQLATVGFDDFPDEFVSGSARESVVSALELEIGIADAGAQHPDEGESGWTLWFGDVLCLDAAGFEVNCEHVGTRTHFQCNGIRPTPCRIK